MKIYFKLFSFFLKSFNFLFSLSHFIITLQGIISNYFNIILYWVSFAKNYWSGNLNKIFFNQKIDYFFVLITADCFRPGTCHFGFLPLSLWWFYLLPFLTLTKHFCVSFCCFVYQMSWRDICLKCINKQIK